MASKNNSFPLNNAQKAAAEAPLSPLLIVAGAGTGKTKTLISRMLYLIEQGMAPERICAITFTNKAAKEMADRARLGHGGGEFFMGTFHSLGARILRKEAGSVGRKPNFGIFDDHDSFELVKKAIKGADVKDKKDTPAYFAQKIAEIKNLGAVADDARLEPEKKTLIRTIFERYEEALKRNNAFDFDDLIQKPVAIFREHPEILRKYQNRFDAILVDEYQDINPSQYELVKLLAQGHRNLSVVGDDEQTIYSWRYADIKTFLNFDKDWPGAKVYFLEENYRSTGNIIEAAAAVVQNNSFRTPKKLWTGNPEGDKLTLYEAWGENEEAEWVGMEIQKLMRRASAMDIGILYRTNAQSRAIEQALIRRNIAYRIFGGLKFYERREVKDAVAALRFVSNGNDEVAQERLEKNLTKRKFAAFRKNVLEARGAVEDATGETMKPTDAIKIFLETFGYFDYLDHHFLHADERQENIAELIDFASEFENLGDLLERLSLVQSTDDKKGNSDGHNEAGAKVSLMTIHLAKGLEFDAVFVIGCAEGLLPHIRSIDSGTAVEEERRLMYVAMTRARKKLFVSFYGLPSRFVSEIPEERIEAAKENHDGGESDPEENIVEY